jgi:RHS repeat-associated protein
MKRYSNSPIEQKPLSACADMRRETRDMRPHHQRAFFTQSNSRLSSQVSSLKSHISSLKSHISSLKSHISSLKSHISRLKSHISSLSSHISCLISQVSRLAKAMRVENPPIFIFILFFLGTNSFMQAQVVGGRSNGQSAPQQVKAAELSKGGFTSDVSLFSGALSSGYSLGSVSTPGGLSYALNLNYTSSFAGGDNVPIASGIPYGEGWSVAVPTITVNTEAWSKYTDQQLASALLSGTDNNRIEYTLAQAREEGQLYYFSPHISIPGVVNENFVFKYYDLQNGEAVFVPNKFETYIEARFTQNNWRVITANGDVYAFAITQIGVRNASNQRTGRASNDSSQVITDDGDALYNLVVPQEEILAWYCTSIYNPNASSGQQIIFRYEQFGQFDYYKEFAQARLEEALRARIADTLDLPAGECIGCHGFFAQALNDSNAAISIDVNTYSSFTVSREIILMDVSARDWNGVFERIELVYQTQNLSGTHNMLLTNQAGVARKDSLYNYAVVYSQGVEANELAMLGLPAIPSGNTSFGTWWRYGHIKSSIAMSINNGNMQGDFVDRNNPYIGLFNDGNAQAVLFREQADALNGIPFNHGFLESGRIGQNLPAGDLYELRTIIRNSNVTQVGSDGFCNFDINIVSGSKATAAGSQGFNLYNNNTQTPDAATWQTYHREAVFTTFNQAIKWNSLTQVNSQNPQYLVTSNVFVMPNLPSQYNGFNIQIGAANSDHNFAYDFIQQQAGRNAATPYWNNINYPVIVANINDDLEPGDPIRNNFGIGMPWHDVRKLYADMDDDNYSNNAPRYNFWWKDSNDVSSYPNKPTRADENVSLNALVLIRYSKNPWMLTQVNHYVVNGVVSDSSSGEILVSRLKLSYEVKRDTTINNRIYNIGDAAENGQICNVFLLKKIQQVPVNSVNNGPIPSLADSLLPTTHFVYTKLHNAFLMDTARVNASAFVLSEITDALGGTVRYTYYPLSDVRTPIVNRYKVRQGSFDASTNVHKATSVALQITPLVQSKIVVSETDATLPKQWNYDYQNRIMRSELPALGTNFKAVGFSISFGFETTTVTEPALVVGGPRPQTLVTHFNAQQNGLLFGRVMKQEVFDENGFILSRAETEFGVNMAFYQGHHRSNIAIDDQTFVEYQTAYYPTAPTSQITELDARATSHYVRALEGWKTNLIAPAYRHSYFVRALKTTTTEFDRAESNTVYAVADDVSRPNTSGHSGNQRTAGNDCGGSQTQVSFISMITEYEYWDADSTGLTTSNGYRLLIDFQNAPSLQLAFEPSWMLYRSKTYSPQHPDAYETQETFHHYDQRNFYAGAPYSFDALHVAVTDRMRALPYQQRVTSKNSGQAPVQQSSYFLYDYRWNQNPDEINEILLDTISGTPCIDSTTTGNLSDTCIKYIGQPPPAGMVLTVVNGQYFYCFGRDPELDENGNQRSTPNPNDPPPPVPNMGFWLAGKLFFREQHTQIDTLALVNDVTIDPTAAHILRFEEVFDNNNVSSYQPVWPYAQMRNMRVNARTELGLEKVVEDAVGVLTKYWYHAPIRTWHIDLTYPCNSYLTTQMREQGMAYAITTGYTRSDSIRSEMNYNIDFSIDTILQANGEVIHYTYDVYGRLHQSFLNGKLRTVNKYHNWNNDHTRSFAQRGAQNYVEAFTLLEENSTQAEHSRSYVDPLGRKYDVQTQVSPNYLTAALDTLMVHSGQTDYDNWSRAIRQYKPFKVSSTQAVSFQPRFNSEDISRTQLYAETQQEGNARNRTMRSATFGENINGAHTQNTSYRLVTGLQLIAETGMSPTEYMALMPVGAAANYRFRKQAVMDEDGKRRVVYSDVYGHTVANKAYISGTQYAVTLFFYDSRGQVVKVINPIKEQSTFVYNLMGLVVQKNNPNNGTCKYMYDMRGQVVMEQDANGAAGTDNSNVPYMRVYSYDVYGRLLKQEFAEVVGYGPLYYANISDATGDLMYSYATSLDFAFNYTHVVPPSTILAYDPYTLINVRRKEKEFIYDVSTNLGLSLHANATAYIQAHPQTHTRGRVVADVAYNETGLPIQYHLYGYNAEGQPAWEIQQFAEAGITSSNTGICGVVENVGYNLRGQIKEQRVNADINSTVEMNYVYAYDGWGRMKSVTLNNILLNDYTYDDALGLVKRVRYYDEAIGCGAVVVDTVQMVYDDRDRLTDLTSHFYDEYLYYDAAHPQTADTSFAVQASKNYNGNINAMKSVYKLDRATYNPGTFEGATVYGFQYDGLNRLTSADASVMDVLTGDPSQATPARLYGDEAYTYDKAGNIKTLVRGMYYHASVQNPANWVQRWTYKYQSGTSKLVSIDSSNTSLRTYAYDANGNTRADVFRGLTSTTMNRANLPVACVVDGESVKNSFGISDLRVYKENQTSGVKTFYWLTSGGQTLGVLTATNTNLTNGTWEFYAGKSAKLASGVRHFSVSDHLGNTRVTYTSTATCDGVSYTLDHVRDYYPYGKILREFVNAKERFGFNGNEREEESGLDYFNARYYDADVCRFLGVDPVVKWHESGYAAFGNNPIYYIDPSGLDAEDPTRTTEEQNTVYSTDPSAYDFTVGDLILVRQGNGDIYTKIACEVKLFDTYTAMYWQTVKVEIHVTDITVSQYSCVISDGSGCEYYIPAQSGGGWVGPANSTNGGIGVLAGVAENLAGDARIGSNWKIYTPTAKGGVFKGNQYVSTAKAAKVGKIAGYATLGIGTVIDLIGVRNYYKYGANDPNAVHPAKAGLNFGIGTWGLINPATATGAALYYGIDTFYPGGFNGAMQQNSSLIEQNQAILGSGWNLYRDH